MLRCVVASIDRIDAGSISTVQERTGLPVFSMSNRSWALLGVIVVVFLTTLIHPTLASRLWLGPTAAPSPSVQNESSVSCPAPEAIKSEPGKLCHRSADTVALMGQGGFCYHAPFGETARWHGDSPKTYEDESLIIDSFLGAWYQKQEGQHRVMCDYLLKKARGGLRLTIDIDSPQQLSGGRWVHSLQGNIDAQHCKAKDPAACRITLQP